MGQDVVSSPAVDDQDQIIVSASDTPSAEEAGPDSVVTISRREIDESGNNTTEDLLRNLTVAGANGISASNESANFTPGASTISLRGFDTGATLILIDGRRVANYPLGANGTDSFVDLKSIPAAAIESIEVLKDTGSTLYGADAIGGVVNIKLRRDYRGAETNVEYGNTTHKDSGEFSASLLFGVGDDNSNVAGVIDYYHRNSIFQRDRAYSAITSQLSSNASPANLELSRAAVVAAGGNPSSDLGDIFFGRAPAFTGGTAPASDYTYAGGRVGDYNFNAHADSLPETQRYGGFIQAEHKIFGDRMILYGDFFFQDVKTHDELAPAATDDFELYGIPTIAVPPRAPGATLGGPSYSGTGVPFGAFNPFQQIISGGSRARLVEFGDRVFDSQTEALFSTAGLKGRKLFDGTWSYDTAFRYSQIQNTFGGTFASASRFGSLES